MSQMQTANANFASWSQPRENLNDALTISDLATLIL